MIFSQFFYFFGAKQKKPPQKRHFTIPLLRRLGFYDRLRQWTFQFFAQTAAPLVNSATLIVIIGAKEPYDNDDGDDYPYAVAVEPSAAVIAARIAGVARITVVSHLY